MLTCANCGEQNPERARFCLNCGASLAAGEVLVEQGQAGDELYLLFDGVLAVEQDGRQVAEVGPGAILGEMALLEGGRRTATLRAMTRCRVAVVPGDRVDRAALAEVARRRRDGG